MRRETRINLIFLTVFVIFALPGAVILFRKKLDPTAHRLDQPDPVLHRLPYMSPLPAPPDIKWIVPDRTQAWVKSLTAPVPTLSAGPPGPQWEPVISADHLLQVLKFEPMSSDNHLTLLLWRELPEPRPDDFVATVDQTTARVVSAKSTPLPPEVRHELVMSGFVRPPKEVVLLEVNIPQMPASRSHRVDLSYTRPGLTVRTTVEFKTRDSVPGATD